MRRHFESLELCCVRTKGSDVDELHEDDTEESDSDE